MKKIILLLILTIGLLNATEYRLTHLKKGAKLNVRELPVVNSRTVVGSLPYNAIGIKIRECKYNKQGKEWCYISYPIGGKHIEGWISRYYLQSMDDEWFASKLYIRNFLKNYYMADEENFLDKLKVFYHFPMQQYMWKKSVSHLQLRSQKVSFYKKWPTRSYNMTYMKILKRRDTYIDVQTTIRWRVKNSKDYESGKDIQKIRLVHDGERFQVLAIKNLKHTVFPKKTIEENTTIADTNQTIVADANKKYYIKIGSFFMQPSDEFFLNIGQNGFKYIQLEDRDQDGNLVKRIYIGPYNTEDEVVAVLDRVRESINKNAYIQSFY
jgi:hypothetical protein